jgi:hypothetical protein
MTQTAPTYQETVTEDNRRKAVADELWATKDALVQQVMQGNATPETFERFNQVAAEWDEADRAASELLPEVCKPILAQLFSYHGRPAFTGCGG